MRLTKALRTDWAGSLYKGLSVTAGSAAAILCSWFLTPILLGCAFIVVVVLPYWLLNTDTPKGGGVEQLDGGMLMASAPVLALLWLFAGFAGVLSWSWLSACFWLGGTAKLKQMHWIWWVSLLAGVLAAAPLVLDGFPRSLADEVGRLQYALVTLTFLSAYLFCLRLRSVVLSPPHIPPAVPRTLKQLIDETD